MMVGVIALARDDGNPGRHRPAKGIPQPLGCRELITVSVSEFVDEQVGSAGLLLWPASGHSYIEQASWLLQERVTKGGPVDFQVLHDVAILESSPPHVYLGPAVQAFSCGPWINNAEHMPAVCGSGVQGSAVKSDRANASANP